ncbi:MAG TPA: phosphoglycerate dehydrogenase [Conexibacter sp.]|nr:phosphoglycerate dehydrogenase [Conexibacter sp.]
MSGSVDSSPAEVLVTWLHYDESDPHTGGRLRDAGLTMRLSPRTGERTPDDVAALAHDAVGAIVSTDPFDASVFERCPGLRVVARVGVGYDSIDLDAATAAGVVVTICPGANEETVADHTLALLLALVRRVVENDAAVRAGRWDRAGALTPWDLRGCTVGLVGYGVIGRAVGRRLAGFEPKLLVCDPVAEPQEGIELVELDELLRRSEVVSLHAPLLAETENLIGARELALMRDDAILLNTSRGRLIDEDALFVALRDGSLRGAALDVFADEPPAGSPLLELPNIVLSPHIGGISERSMATMTRQATASVVDVLAGREPVGVLNPAALPAALGRARSSAA